MLLLCSRCGKVVILNVFKTGINAVSFLPACFLAVFLTFSKSQWQLRHTDSSGLARVLGYDLHRKRKLACFVYISVSPPTVALY